MPDGLHRALAGHAAVSGTPVPPVHVASAPLLAEEAGYRIAGIDNAPATDAPLV